MKDQFLRAHKAADGEYVLGSPFYYPISIRDQVLRATYFVHRAISVGLIKVDSDNPTAEKHPLLIVGAGVSGAAAGMLSSHLGVTTILIERNPAAFERQSMSARKIDFNQYDWPAKHWKDETWTPEGPPFNTSPLTTLTLNRGITSALAAGWAVQLRDAVDHSGGKLETRFGTHIETCQPIKSSKSHCGMRVRLSSNHVINACLILYTTGFGIERSQFGGYPGFDFWRDNFQLGLDKKAKVLISGGGDGALQDYLRLVSGGMTGAEILRQVFWKNGAVDYTIKDPLVENLYKAEREILEAENEAQRAYVWFVEQERAHHDKKYPHYNDYYLEHDQRVLNKLHEAFQNTVLRFWDNVKKASVESRLISALEALTCTHPKPYLVNRTRAFSMCYALNRFLVLLFLHYFDRHTKEFKDRFYGLHKIEEIKGVSPHTCNPSTSGGCPFGSSHRVTVVPVEGHYPRLPSISGDFELVIIRHGIDPQLPTSTPIIPFPRQLLPTHFF